MSYPIEITNVFDANPSYKFVWVNDDITNWAWYPKQGFKQVGRSEVMSSTNETSKELEKSTDMNASKAIEAISAMKSIEEIKAFIEGDERKGVNSFAQEKISEL